MINVARSLSLRAEFCVVVFVGFGYFIFANALYLLYPSASSAITDASLRELVVFELIVLCLLGALLYARGWRIARFGSPFTLADLGIAMALMIGAYVFSIFATLLAAAIGSNAVGSSDAVDFVSNGIQPLQLAAKAAGSVQGPWRLANSPALAIALLTAYFESFGLPRLYGMTLNPPNRRMRTRMSGGVAGARG